MDQTQSNSYLIQFGNKTELSNNTAGICNLYWKCDALAVSYLSKVETNAVQSHHGKRLVFKAIKYLHQLLVDLFSFGLDHVLVGHLHGRVHGFVV